MSTLLGIVRSTKHVCFFKKSLFSQVNELNFESRNKFLFFSNIHYSDEALCFINFDQRKAKRISVQ